MSDIATLGIAVDSSNVKKATADLDALSRAAKTVPEPIGAIEAAAKRAGVSVDDMRQRMAAASSGTSIFKQAIDGAAKSAANYAGPLGAIEAAAKRSGITFEEMRQRIAGASTAHNTLGAALALTSG